MGFAALLVGTLPLLSPGPADAGAPSGDGSPWTAISAPVRHSSDGHRATVLPTHSRAYALDRPSMQRTLDRAPTEGSGGAGTIVSLPAPTGELVDFRVVESPVMEAGLAARHPELTTYVGTAVSDPATTVALDLTRLGFHASVRGPQGRGTWLIDPAYVGDQSVYRSYLGQDVPAPQRGLTEPELDDETAAKVVKQGRKVAEAPGQEVTRRTYRLALLTDPTYATYFGTENVLSAKVTLMSRVNQIYTNDLAIRMVLIDDTDKLNLDTNAKAMGANGPCGATACYTAAQLDPAATSTNGCTSGILTRTRFVIGQLVGAANFDIGHIGLGLNGGGIASLGVVGGSSKAQGCTGIPTPTGDYYAIDYVAHEMGHQFSGNHTFNGNQVNCASTNRTAAASVEPGSGSSVMAYAGICVNDDLQPHTDPYFSQRTQTEVTNYTTSTLANANEVQEVALTGFNTNGMSFTLTFPGLGTTAPIVRGTNYSAAGIKAAVEAVTGSTVTATNFFATNGQPSDPGFTVTYTGALAGSDVPNPTLTVVSGSFTGFANDITKGGPPTNGGSSFDTFGNHAPTVTAAPGKFIPTRTPFTLSGSGSDPDGNSLIYLWEQNDRGANTGTRLVTNTKTNGPLFRVFGTYADVTPAGTLEFESPGENLATTSATRTFPDMAQVLAGNTNAKTGECPVPAESDYVDGQPTRTLSDGSVVDNRLVNGRVLDCYSVFLPTAGYAGASAAPNDEPSLNFRLTARDQNPMSGGYQFADTKLRLDRTAGPLLVTSQGPGTAAVTGKTTGEVTWDVNNTDRASLAPQVRIKLSTNGGKTFPTTLTETANDGSATVTWPNVGTSHARLMVEAVDNYFFAVNDAEFSIGAVAEPTFTLAGPADTTVDAQYSDPVSPDTTFTAHASSASEAAALSASASGLPSGLTLTRQPAGADSSTVVWTVTGAVTGAPGAYPVTVVVTDGSTTGTATFTVTVTAESAEVTYTGPTSVTTGGDTAHPTLTAQLTEQADGHPGDLTTATVAFRSGDRTLCTSPVSASGGASCAADLPGDGGDVPLSLEVGGGNYAGSGSGTLHVAVDDTAPETSITGGPADGGFLLDDDVTFDVTSSETPATFTCLLDGADAGCGTLTGLTHRTHTFSAAASDQFGNTDVSPASRTFGVPLSDGQLTNVRHGWTRKSGAGAYLGSFSVATAKGATLRRSITDATKLALVVGKGRGFGKVTVLLDGVKLRTVSLAGAPAGKVLVPVASFGSPRSGTVTIVSKSAKKVRIEGLGVLAS